MKKKLALAVSTTLSAAVLAASLAGCGTGAQDYNGVTPTPAPVTENPLQTAAPAPDYDAAYALHEPGDIVMTVDGTDVTWSEFFYDLTGTIAYLEQYVGTIADFSAPSPFDTGSEEETTYGDYLKDGAVELCKQYHALIVNAEKAGIALTDEQQQALDERLESDKITLVGEDATDEEFYDFLASIYVTPEVYELVNRGAALYSACAEEFYGATGEKVSDADAQSFIDEYGYMSAKHIVLLSTDAEGNPLSDEKLAENRKTLEDIRAQVAAVTDNAAREELFTQLMNEKSEDTGLPYYPNGYTFTASEMVEEFSSAAAALADYELSDIVETDYGIHLILRLPTARDSVVDTYGNTIAIMAASAAYDALIDEWIAGAEVVWTPEFENLDVAELLATK